MTLISMKPSIGPPPGKIADLGEFGKIHYEQVGDGAQVLLLIPGAIGSTRSDFSAQLNETSGLSRDEFTIVAIDLPGYGYSRPPERDHSAEIYYQDGRVCAALMDKLGHRIYSVAGGQTAPRSLSLSPSRIPAALRSSSCGVCSPMERITPSLPWDEHVT